MQGKSEGGTNYSQLAGATQLAGSTDMDFADTRRSLGNPNSVREGHKGQEVVGRQQLGEVGRWWGLAVECFGWGLGVEAREVVRDRSCWRLFCSWLSIVIYTAPGFSPTA